MGTSFDEMFGEPKDTGLPVSVKGVPVKTQDWLDADTVNADGQSYRISGFNAPEVAHIKGGIFVPGEVLNDDTMRQQQELSSLKGYTEIQPTGVEDKYRRKVAKVINPNLPYQGDVGSDMIAIGAVKPDAFTKTESIQKNINLRAATALFGNPGNDPVTAMAMKNFDKPLDVVPKMTVTDEATYASAKGMIGVGAAAKAAAEVDRLSGILKDPSLRPDLREKLSKQKEEAQQAVWTASTTPDFVGNVLVRHNDRNMMNMAHDPMTTALTGAVMDMATGVGGILQMVGDTTKWDWLSKRAAAGIRQQKMEQGQLPNYLSDFHDIKTDTAWNAVTDTVQYLGNQFAGSIPMMAALIAGTAATGGMAPVAGFATSMLPGSIEYTGQYYANQEEGKKNAGLALSLGVGSAVLDRLGLDAMMYKGNLFTLVGKNEVVALMKKKAADEGKVLATKEAESILENATKKEITELAGTGAAFAKQQVLTSEAMMRGLGTLAVNVGGETATETTQQYAQMVAEKGEWNNDAIYDRDFSNQMLNAAIGGSSMSGAMHFTGQVQDAAQWHSVADSYRDYTKGLNEAQQFQAENQRQLEGGTGGYHSIADAASRVSYSSVGAADLDINKMQGLEGNWNGVKSILTDPGRLLRQLAHTVAPSIVSEDGSFRSNMAILKSIMGGYGILPGDHMIGYKQRLMGKWGGNTAETLATEMKTDVGTVNTLVKGAYDNYWSKGNRLPDTPGNRLLQEWKDSQDGMLQDMRTTAQSHNVRIDDLNNPHALFEAAAVDPRTVQKSKAKIIEALVAAGETSRAAEQVFQGLLSGNKLSAQQSRDMMSRLGIFSNPELSHIFESNLFTSIENLKERTATELAQKVFLGEKGSNLTKLLLKAKADGEFANENEYLDAVKNVKDWYQIVTGSYHPLDNYPKLKKVLGWATTMTMLASLGKAAISSQTEVAMSTLGTPAHLIQKQLGTYISEFAKEYKSDINKFSSWSTAWTGIAAFKARRVPSYEKEYARIDAIEKDLSTAGISADRVDSLTKEIEELHEKVFARTLFERLGYNESGFNTQSKFEYTDNNPRQAMQYFAATIGLRAQTDSTRMAVLSIAGDVVIGKINSLMMIPKENRKMAFMTGSGMTNEQAQSLAELQQYGLDVLSTIEYLEQFKGGVEAAVKNGMDPRSKSVDSTFQEQLMTVLGNIVDSRVVNPQGHNMPKYMNDPRLRLITAMGRFMSAAHAVILPRLYKQYMLDGNVGMRYQAFSTMAMALLFAAFANMLKDELSYGDDNPYIKGPRKNIQRTINSSGLLGQFEKLTDAVLPLYPNVGPEFSNNPAGWAVNKATSISPQLSWAQRPVVAAMDIGQGKNAEAAKQLVRAMPLVGSFPLAANKAAELFK